MIQISDSAQGHFRKLIEREALPGLGVRLSAMHAGMPDADVRLEFALDDGRTPSLLNAPLVPELVDVLDRLQG